MVFKKNSEETPEVEVEKTLQEPVEEENTPKESTENLKELYLNAIKDMCDIIDSQINIMQKLKDSLSKLPDE